MHKGQIYRAKTHTQMPLRLSTDFCWQKGERIELQSQAISGGTTDNGWIVLNMDYCGVELCFETSFITKELLKTNFEPCT